MPPKLISNKFKSASHESRLIELISSNDNMILCSGWLNYQALDILYPAFKEAFSRGASIQLIFSEKNIRAPRWIDSRLKKIKKASKDKGSFSHHMIPRDKQFVHAKAYLFERDSGYSLIVGSANLMHSGLNTYNELSIELNGSIGDSMHESIVSYFCSVSPDQVKE